MADQGDSKRRASTKLRSLASFSNIRSRVSKMGKDMSQASRVLQPRGLPSFRLRKSARAADAGRSGPTDEQRAHIESMIESFALEGGPSQAELIVAKSGDRMVGGLADQELVHLLWYRATAGGVFERIRGVKRGFYQPSVDDLGARVCAQCCSAFDHTLAAFAEVGPIVLAESTRERVEKITRDGEQLDLQSVLLEGNSGQDNALQLTSTSIKIFAASGDGSAVVEHLIYSNTKVALDPADSKRLVFWYAPHAGTTSARESGPGEGHGGGSDGESGADDDDEDDDEDDAADPLARHLPPGSRGTIIRVSSPADRDVLALCIRDHASKAGPFVAAAPGPTSASAVQEVVLTAELQSPVDGTSSADTAAATRDATVSTPHRDARKKVPVVSSVSESAVQVSVSTPEPSQAEPDRQRAESAGASAVLEGDLSAFLGDDAEGGCTAEDAEALRSELRAWRERAEKEGAKAASEADAARKARAVADKLTTEASLLSRELSTLRSERDSLRLDRDSARRSLADTERKLAEKEKLATESQAMVSSLSASLAALKASMQDATDHSSSLQQVNDAREATIKLVHQQLEEERAAHSKTVQAASTSVERIAALEQALAVSEAKAKQAEERRRAAEGQLKELEGREAAALARTREAERQLELTRANLTACKESLLGERERAQAAQQAADEAAQALVKEADARTTAVRTAEEERARAARALQEDSDMRKRKAELEGAVEALTAQLSQEVQAREAADKRAEAVREALEELEAERNALRKKEKSLSRELAKRVRPGDDRAASAFVDPAPASSSETAAVQTLVREKDAMRAEILAAEEEISRLRLRCAAQEEQLRTAHAHGAGAGDGNTSAPEDEDRLPRRPSESLREKDAVLEPSKPQARKGSGMRSLFKKGPSAALRSAEEQAHAMQHIINSLTDQLKDKDEALDEQRRANRMLAQRVRDLEDAAARGR